MYLKNNAQALISYNIFHWTSNLVMTKKMRWKRDK